MLFGAVVLAIACGPTSAIDPAFGKGVAAQSFPVDCCGGNGHAGREVSGTTEINQIASLNARWYYNYLPTTDIVTPGVAFVPMIFDHSYVTQQNLDAAKNDPANTGGILMGFNEPDHAPPQANMTVAQALADWPSLEATGLKLVCPVTASDPSVNGSWLDLFTSGNGGQYIPRCDYIPIHFYTSTFTPASNTALSNLLNAVYAHYPKKHVWITELGMINFAGPTYPTVAQADAQIRSWIPFLRTQGLVDRWVWYPMDAMAQLIADDPNYANITLGNLDGSLTSLGTTYAGQ